MMKPWEEEWIVARRNGSNVALDWDVYDGDRGGIVDMGTPERAALAAAAPGMALLLLQCERGGRAYRNTTSCPWCEGAENYLPDSTHKSNCEFMRVMRNAGVLP